MNSLFFSITGLVLGFILGSFLQIEEKEKPKEDLWVCIASSPYSSICTKDENEMEFLFDRLNEQLNKENVYNMSI